MQPAKADGATTLGFRGRKGGAAPDVKVVKAGADACAAAKRPPATGLAAAAEARLRAFDLDSRFGPCLSPASRRARWERAQALGLGPPKEVLELLDGQRVRQHCLWWGRV
jgi:DNA polymerase delta subunit 4